MCTSPVVWGMFCMEAQKCEADFESTSEFSLWSPVVPSEYKVYLHGMSVIRNAAF